MPDQRAGGVPPDHGEASRGERRSMTRARHRGSFNGNHLRVSGLSRRGAGPVACALRARAGATARVAGPELRRKGREGEADLSTKQAEACQDARLSGQDGHPWRSGRAQGSPAEGPAPSGRLTVGPRQTAPLSSRRAFAALGARGSRGGSDLVRVRFLAAEQDDGPPQIAYAIPRRVAGAVGRNRIRRRLRAAADLLSAELSPGDYLISPDPRCRTAPFTELVEGLRAGLASAGAVRSGVT